MSTLTNMQSFDLVLAAKAKIKNLPENFLVYKFSWLGDINDDATCIMEVTGAEFRAAKSGPRKGEICMVIKNTERKTFLTPSEIDALKTE